jgi:hypothetical protein
MKIIQIDRARRCSAHSSSFTYLTSSSVSDTSNISDISVTPHLPADVISSAQCCELLRNTALATDFGAARTKMLHYRKLRRSTAKFDISKGAFTYRLLISLRKRIKKSLFWLIKPKSWLKKPAHKCSLTSQQICATWCNIKFCRWRCISVSA